MKIKVLFIPATMPSHMICLMALAGQLGKDHFEVAFLLPVEYHSYAKSLGFSVIDIDRKLQYRTIPEMRAIAQFNPDVLVDDLSYTTAYSSRLTKIPRLSIIRKGLFPFEKPMPGYHHTCPYIETLTEKLDELQLDKNNVWKPQHFSELFIGDINIIPSLPSVDVLPEELDTNRYRYAGPLLLNDDDIMQSLQYLPFFSGENPPDIDDFFKANKERKIVYFTMGLTYFEGRNRQPARCVQYLLNKGVAVITNIIDAAPPGTDYNGRLYRAALLPMHKICSRVNGMIHHCGSGTYNYQLFHQLPAIILGTKHYDRDAVAMRLNELGAAHYISPDLEDDTWFKNFEGAVSGLLDSESVFFQKQKTALRKLAIEMESVQRHFDLEAIVQNVVACPTQYNS